MFSVEYLAPLLVIYCYANFALFLSYLSAISPPLQYATAVDRCLSCVFCVYRGKM